MTDIGTLRNFNHDFDEIVAKYGARTALISSASGQEITYSELDILVDRHLAWIAALGLRPGQCIGAVLPNSVEMLSLFLAVFRGGFRLAPLACDTTASEVARWADLTKPACCFYSVLLEETRVESLRQTGLQLLPVSSNGQFDYIPGATSDTVRADGAKLYLFTSGTTGESKALVIDADSLWSSGYEFIRCHGANFDDRFRIWNYLPQSYLGGLFNMALIPFSVAGSVVVDEVFSGITFLKFWQEIDRYDINVLWLVPTIVRGLIAIGDRTNRQSKVSYKDRVKLALIGTAPIELDTKERFENMFGITLYENFALSETTFITSEFSSNVQFRCEGSVGEVLPYVQAEYRQVGNDESDDFREILVRTPYLMDGYLSADGSITLDVTDRFFATGDLGYVDASGQLVVTGRTKDIIKKGGYFIGLREIEVLACKHPAVEEAAAAAVPHDFYGESYVLYIRIRPDAGPDAETDIRSYVFNALAKHKWPKSVDIVEVFPQDKQWKDSQIPPWSRKLSDSQAPISRRVVDIPPAMSIHINEIVYALKRLGKDITTLSLGEAFFDIPLFDWSKIDFVRGYHYSDSQGLPELRTLISEFYLEHYGTKIDARSEILITAGSKAAIYLAILATVNPGSEVLIHEPAWLSYREHVHLAEASARFIPYNAAPSEFGEWFTDRTRMLIINNPNNPAGRLYTPAELSAMVEICKRHKVWLLVDEAYSDFLAEGSFASALDLDPDRETVIVANSLSKNMGMSGWRIGYIVSHPRLIDQVLKLNQHIITCAPTVLQAYLARYFKDIIQITLPQARDVVLKRQRVAKRIDSLNLTCLPGCATFYFFVDLKDHPASSYDLSLYLLLIHNISVVPGAAYGASTERFIRVSIGTESEERIADALAVLRNVLAERKDITALVNDKLADLGIRRF